MKSYIGYSTNSDIRYKATSGGIGTTIIKWLFDNKLIGTSISFEFDPITLRYVPKIIHSFDEYQICGSIYQEIDLIGFVKSHQNEIKGNTCLFRFTLPNQGHKINLWKIWSQSIHNRVNLLFATNTWCDQVFIKTNQYKRTKCLPYPI